jgi:2-oxoglutarate ferredoxin oxidoreductase subunit beta
MKDAEMVKIGERVNIPLDRLFTGQKMTWCPGCPDYMILESAKRAITKLILDGHKQENFVMAAGIGCHGKIFDYINISGFYCLHGRVIPTAIGMHIGNPNLTVLGFAGDGDTYSEGMSHFINAGRYNPDITLIVNDNQSFSLTTGQPTPTTQQGFKSKANPFGEFNQPLNPIRLALASGISFIARCNARDIDHTAEVLEKAIKHKGFSFVEIIQDCIVFNPEINNKDKFMYKIKDNEDIKKAYLLANEWDYNNIGGKIPIGVIYKEEKPVLTDKWPQLANLKKKKMNWKDYRK